MKTYQKYLKAMGMVFLMSFVLAAGAQFLLADDMKKPMEGQLQEMTEPGIKPAMETMEKETMKEDMQEMVGKEMESTMETMQGDMMQDDVKTNVDKMK